MRSMAPFRWFGGKGTLKSKLLPLIPESKVYVEAYGGAASVLFAKKQVPIEVYNDLDGNLVNLFRALQDPVRFEKLKHRLLYTLYSRTEYLKAIKILRSPGAKKDDRAWAFYVAQNQIISGITEWTPGRWGRAKTTKRGMAANTSKWCTRQTLFDWWHKRLMRVQIEQLDALKLIPVWDDEHTVFYLDPPYVKSTRTSGKYHHDIDDDHHHALIALLLKVQGGVILSGYENGLYADLEAAGWDKVRFKTRINASVNRKGGKRKKSMRYEVVWRNPRAVKLLQIQQNRMFT